jgi:glycosyltransferase involved in cell wall biosynthesis
MKETPTITVIIPTYNRSALLKRAIKSVLNQTFTDFELLVVDDASTDDTEAVVANIKDSRIIYLKHKKNSNGAVARNTGILNSNGKYITFLDSDDIWIKNKLEISYINIMGKDANTVLYSSLIVDNGEKQLKMPLKGIGNSRVDEYLFVNNGIIQTNTIMVHNSVAKKFKFNSNLSMHQDWDYCITLYNNGMEFFYLDEPTAIWFTDPKRTDRVSKKKDLGFSLKWINSINISKRAYYGFKVRYLLPIYSHEIKKRESLKWILNGYKSNSYNLLRTIYYLRYLFPEFIKFILNSFKKN